MSVSTSFDVSQKKYLRVWTFCRYRGEPSRCQYQYGQPSSSFHVAGLNKTISENIVKYREEGKITSRAQIKKVPRLGAKAFEQAAGFLRIPESSNILDNTGVHPENYAAVKELFKRLDIKDLNEEAQGKLKSLSVKEMAQS